MILSVRRPLMPHHRPQANDLQRQLQQSLYLKATTTECVLEVRIVKSINFLSTKINSGAAYQRVKLNSERIAQFERPSTTMSDDSSASSAESVKETEEITDLTNSDVCTKYQEASKIVNLALKGLIGQCVVGAKVLDLCKVRLALEGWSIPIALGLICI